MPPVPGLPVTESPFDLSRAVIAQTADATGHPSTKRLAAPSRGRRLGTRMIPAGKQLHAGWNRLLVITGALLLATRLFAADATRTVKVFIFAGQSNMEGADAHPERIDDFPMFQGAGAPQ